MFLSKLELKNFRNYQNLKLDFNRGTTLITGDNGQGKTNLLESIYYLSCGKSHRTASQKELIMDGQDFALIRAMIQGADKPRLIEFELRRDNSYKLRIDRVYFRRKSEFTSLVSAVIFSPDDLNIIKSSPSHRRNFLDHILDSTHNNFPGIRLKYQKTLNQRNSLIKSMSRQKLSGDNPTLKVWNENLINYGKKIIEYRLELVQGIEERFSQLVEYFFPGCRAKLAYVPSWNREKNQSPATAGGMESDYKEAMTDAWDKDLALKSTTIGPHRDDLYISLQGSDLRSFGSQGQQRIAAVSLKLCELFFLNQQLGKSPILLLDDVLSELDVIRKKLLIEKLGDGFQTFITAANIHYLDDLPLNIAASHVVKNGNIYSGD
ncbi:MAG: DNA replication/repair protein RecF [Actinomycetia bacterium]|nr:DNA replication/repair protein RecF [Actinomycetes bacterium]